MQLQLENYKMTAIPKRIFHEDDYLMRELRSPEKHEYYLGEIFAMAGALLPHNEVASNLNSIVGPSLRGSGCKFLGSDMRVLVESTKFFTYPDGSIVCGKPVIVKRLGDHLTNPKVIFEVLSPSTASYDRKEKFELYKCLSSFVEYVLVDPSQYHVEVYMKRKNGRWAKRFTTNLTETVKLESVGIELAMKDIYDGVTFPEAG